MRPSSYDEDEDKGGGILTEEELNNGRPGTGSDAAKGDKVVNEDKKTPLILDPSEEVKTFFDKYNWPMPPRYLFRREKWNKEKDAVESYRKTLVGD